MQFNRRGIFWSLICYVCLVGALTCLGFFFPTYTINQSRKGNYEADINRKNATWSGEVGYFTPRNRYLQIYVYIYYLSNI